MLKRRRRKGVCGRNKKKEGMEDFQKKLKIIWPNRIASE